MNTIAFLVYGDNEEYQLELTYCVLSIVRFREPVRIVLITTPDKARNDLPVEHIFIGHGELREWAGPHNYNHRAKLEALRRAVDGADDKVALIDTDTYFVKSPAELFARIGPQRSVMQFNEGKLGQKAEWALITGQKGRLWDGYEVNENTDMYNSGVIGMHASLKPRVEEMAKLADLLYGEAPIFNAEQFAVTHILQQYSLVSVCPDIVMHYWGHLRPFVHLQVKRLFPQFSTELFERARNRPFAGFGFPATRLADKLAARLKMLRRQNDDSYRWAYLAYRSSLWCSTRDPELANAWATVAAMAIGQATKSKGSAPSDFAAFSPQHLEMIPWMAEKTKQRWRGFWAAR